MNLYMWLLRALNRTCNRSFSQCGEDRIIEFVASQIGVSIKSYFDIGANDPVKGSNTFLFYCKGAKGVCVEPIPRLADIFVKTRPKDEVLRNAVSAQHQRVEFYELDPSTLSTFDKRALTQALLTPGARLVNTLEVETITLNHLFERYGTPEMISIDIEGGDLDVLKGWDTTKHRPAIVCVEDLEYSCTRGVKTSLGVADHLVECGYMRFADTFINSVLVDTKLWLAGSDL